MKPISKEVLEVKLCPILNGWLEDFLIKKHNMTINEFNDLHFTIKSGLYLEFFDVNHFHISIIHLGCFDEWGWEFEYGTYRTSGKNRNGVNRDDCLIDCINEINNFYIKHYENERSKGTEA